MADEPVARKAPRRDWRKGWLWPFVAFLAMLLFTLLWLGVFRQATVERAPMGPYLYVYEPFAGRYPDMVKAREALKKRLLSAGLTPASAMTLIEHEQGGQSAAVTARVGVLVNPGSPVPAGLQQGVWPRQMAVSVEVNAYHAVASLKAYSALKAWLKVRGLPAHYPLLEIIGPGDRYRLLMPVAASGGTAPAVSSRP
ncbi:hypothetical protein HF668_03330 [Acidithiobacillus ferridurans]|uniref:hypothetical protein n=1 Tax=Acidithiobacillus ferridurans TaxID=1232575 RepID=UPI001C07E12B|nr:hypothetical protein [Acidithiobacillus ferridurans]MBU2804203.1 hypothetical protein [Acidithiobacillus ferridurans]